MSMELVVTDIQAKTWLVFVKRKHPVWSRLSLNLLREIGTYLLDCLYPCGHLSTLIVYNLETGAVKQKTPISHSFDNGTVYCPYAPNRVLCIGAEPTITSVFSLCTATGELRAMPDMMLGRAWPGVVLWEDTVYVFGGQHGQPTAEAEKFRISPGAWRKLASMSVPKLAFTPLLHTKQIYLIACSPMGPLPIETFNPYTETYTTLNVRIDGSGFGAISFLKGDEVLTVLYGGELLHWNPTSTTYRKDKVSLPDIESAISGGPVRRYKDWVYWVNYHTGNLVQFDLNAEEVVMPEKSVKHRNR